MPAYGKSQFFSGTLGLTLGWGVADPRNTPVLHMCSRFTHGSPSIMLRPASQAGPMHESAGVGKLVNAVLLSLINEACVSVCCATLSNELVGPTCVHARSSNPRGRVCRPSGKVLGEEGIE